MTMHNCGGYTVASPGGRAGPCTDPNCVNPSCVSCRVLAAYPCLICDRPIGYNIFLIFYVANGTLFVRHTTCP